MNKMSIPRGCALALAVAIGSVAPAATYYVDRSRPDDTGDGTSEATAKQSIQAAVDRAEQDSEEATIVVLPGVYDNGSVRSRDADDSLLTRVKISKKMTLKSRDGRETTHIVGNWSASDATYGLGSDAMRCVTILAKDVIVEGFTIRNGSTFAQDGGSSVYDERGGGVFVDASSVYNAAYICDCTISDCAAANGGGGLYYGTAVRSLLVRNRCKGYTGGRYGSACADANLAQSIVARNLGWCAIAGNTKIVNCSICENGSTALYPTWSIKSYVYNSIIVGHDKNGPEGVGGNGGLSECHSSLCEAASRFITVDANSNTNASFEQFYAPAIGDFRLLPDVEAIGFGDPAYLTQVTVPAAHANRDYFGNAIDTTKAINAGAVQTVGPTPASGKLTLKGNTKGNPTICANGFGYRTKTGDSYVYSDTWPRQIRLTSSHERLYAFMENIEWYRHYPDPSGGLWVTLPPAGMTAEYFDQIPAQTYYVDETGDNAWDGSSPTNVAGTTKGPVRDISAALVKPMKDYTLVLVAPGTYAKGTMTNVVSSSTFAARVCLTSSLVCVRSTAGAKKTFIVGAPDPTSGGYGDGAERCVAIFKTGCVQGFTLTGGWTPTTTKTKVSEAPWCSGGAFYSSENNASYSVVDCIITNNHGYFGSACYQGLTLRSVIAKNPFSYAGMVYKGVYVASLLARTTETWLIRDNAVFVNCTLDGSSSSATQFSATDNSFYNCVMNNGHLFQPYGTSHRFLGNVLWGSSEYKPWCTSDTSKTNEYSYVKTDPKLAAAQRYDCRPAKTSELVGTGSDLLLNNYWRRADSDINGQALVISDGKVMAGAAHTFADTVTLSNVLGSVTITDGAVGENVLSPTKTITITASQTERPFLGFDVDGEMLDRSIRTLTIDETYAGKTVTAVYTKDWYVDANGGDDTADGMTPETARLTLEKVFALPIASGDTVHAAKGTYASGEMYHATGCLLPSRVVIPGSVTLVADEGPEVTFIVGASATDTTRALGLGTGAMRCVAATGASAKLVGFTVTGGHTLAASDTTSVEADRCGGGVYSPAASALTAVDCIISNNTANIGGGGYYANYIRCRLFACDASDKAAASAVSHYKDCYIDHFKTDKSILQWFRTLNGCTVGPNILDASGNAKTAFGDYNSQQDIHFVNTVVLSSFTGMTSYTRQKVVALNSVFLEGSTPLADRMTNCETVVSHELGGFDENCNPIAGSNCPALGLADPKLRDFALMGYNDIDGNPRFSNNAMDAGAFQSDWRARYARLLGGSILDCTYASTNVHEVTRHVRLESGTIDLVVQQGATVKEGAPLAIEAAIDGNGTLQAWHGETLVASLTAAQSSAKVPVSFTEGEYALHFVYVPGENDVGGAELVRCRVPQGLLIIVR